MPLTKDRPPGEAKMWELAESFPLQLRQGLEMVPKLDPSFPPGLPIAIAGMGGSGIAGELLSDLAALTGGPPLLPVRGFELPRWVKPTTPAVFVSYSGNTAETLATYDEAARRAVPRAVVTSGGALAERAQRDQVPLVRIPEGLPPRSGLGYLFGGLLGVLQNALPEAYEHLPAITRSLEGVGPSLRSSEGEPARWAAAWKERELHVYTGDALAGVGRRWKTQTEENAKRLASFDTVPELLHNALVAWDAIPRSAAERHMVLLLRGPLEGPEAARRMDYLASVLREKGAVVEEWRPKLHTPMGELLEAVWTGDYLSLWTAWHAGTDPLPVPAIDKMKKALASTGASPSSTPR